MARSLAALEISADPPARDIAQSPGAGRVFVGYVVSLAMVGAAAVVAFVADHIVQASNLSLVFVVPVVIAAASFGWGQSFVAALLGVAAFNFFFLEPRYSFSVSSPADIWALALLLVVGAVTSAVAAESRRRAVAAERAARQAEALHQLARAIIHPETGPAIPELAADALARIFDAPAVVLAQRDGELIQVGASSGARVSAADREAATWALANDRATRGEAYPFDRGRPELPVRDIELVAAYLAAAPAEGR